jgi:SAM-dependent methyltransferase
MDSSGRDAQVKYRSQRIKIWDRIASRVDQKRLSAKYYHCRLEHIYRFLIPAGSRVLELGCGNGDLLAELKPSMGIGVDFSPEMISRASQRHPSITFLCADAHNIELKGTFDYIILSDLINDIWDVQGLLENIKKNCYAGTRIILNFYSRLWQPALILAQSLGLAISLEQQNWLTLDDVRNFLDIAGFDSIRMWHEVLFPLPIPGIDYLFNKILVKLWPFSLFGLSNFIIARPDPQMKTEAPEPLVSVIIPARNEAGNIPGIFERVPKMGANTELIFVEGHSKDNTYEVIAQNIQQYPGQRSMLLRQDGTGKGDAVRKGFKNASGDILMILDADLTVIPEDLPRFYQALVSGKGEFINGVRLIYPMEEQAMRLFNIIGNKFFSTTFSWILGQPVKDSLCGTKVLWAKNYQVLAANRSYFGDFDTFGDFDLLFGSAKLNLKITDLPIRYRERTYGTTNIQRWKHGWLLLRMVVFSLFKIKFV